MHVGPWLFDFASSGRIRLESSLRGGTDDYLVHVDVGMTPALPTHCRRGAGRVVDWIRQPRLMLGGLANATAAALRSSLHPPCGQGMPALTQASNASTNFS
jgi:hypothetical protein